MGKLHISTEGGIGGNERTRLGKNRGVNLRTGVRSSWEKIRGRSKLLTNVKEKNVQYCGEQWNEVRCRARGVREGEADEY